MRTAVITGGAGGLGRAMAAQLQGKGWFTALVDLPGDELAAIAENHHQKPYACDLTKPAQRKKAFDAIKADRPSIDLVIYNAGITQIGLFAESDAASHKRVFDVNYFAAVETARAFLQDIRSVQGTHLAISSVAGFTPFFKRTSYAASKHAMEGFFASLRSEEAPCGVQVSIAAPSFVATNTIGASTEVSGIARPGSASDGMDHMSADEAAKVILRGIEKRRDFIPVGRVALMAWLLNRASPRLYQRIMERKLRGK